MLLPAHHRLYEEYSQKVNAIYNRFTDLIEPFGIDESWLDVTGTLHLFCGDPVALADRIRETIKAELGITISVGVSFNKIFAKLGSDYKKPDATTLITVENFRNIVWPLPVTDLLFVGRAAARVLAQYGVATIGELAVFDRDALTALLGKQGGQLWSYANGLENSPVAPAGQYVPPKSVGNGLTFPRNLTTREEVRRELALLCDEAAARLRRHGPKAAAAPATHHMATSPAVSASTTPNSTAAPSHSQLITSIVPPIRLSIDSGPSYHTPNRKSISFWLQTAGEKCRIAYPNVF